MLKKWLTKRTMTIALVIILLVLFVYFILPISIPLIIALLLALMIEPLIRRLELKFGSRKWSVTTIYSLILGLLLLFIYFFLTKLIQNIIQLATDLPAKMNGLIDAWSHIEARINTILPASVTTAINDEVQKFLLSMRDSIVSYFNVENITGFISALPELLISGLVFLVALFLFMLEIPKIKQFFRNHMYDSTYQKSLFVWKRISGSIFGMIRAAFILSFITWVFTFIGLLFITFENALVMSLVICVVDLLPIVGATGITIPWALYEYFTGDHIMAVKLIVLSLFLLVQRKVLEPKVMGNGVGLSPLPTLIAMYIGLKLMGFIGFFVGPIVLILILTFIESGAIKTNFKI
ncbi:sporulation integral membrane protein YtvI [Macrococcus equipercicus]|uniref:Sporulation integral membrane protein YtvI n=1 Tax=Macrococcus equipercicus TaxID=69967 RepID=A0A9Q9BUU9_9STAP|nr:sporulation integral membrane protein YtvI [Macrococcus equipercicus]KAA1042690.1 sporulation integral membrane protein YtvI [Macrococcus equipercicus]UTH14556.1 sporulation integral membrane protein YtvI [Macrococcus equipercicus]